uniref:wax ester/triacylglycerol synthase family O-acyltransferase n=1 Tax=Aciditerrimonas ferrireducens TaxID=667306 RepID=UPI00367029E9
MASGGAAGARPGPPGLPPAGTVPERPVPTSGLDAFFSAVEGPTTPMLVTAVAVLDPPPGGSVAAASVQRELGERAGRLPALARRLSGGPLGLEAPHWRPVDQLDLAYHLRRAALPSPGGLPEVADLAGELLSHPLDLSQPPWRLWVVEGLAGGGLVLVAQAHHALVDGVAGLGTFAQLLVPGPPASRRGTAAAAPLAPRSSGSDPGQGDAGRAPGVLAALEALPWFLGWSGSTEEAARRSGPFRCPRAPWNGTVSARRVVAFAHLPLAAFQAARATGATVNDVLLTTVGLALRRWLPPEATGPGSRSLSALVPVSLRPSPPAGGPLDDEPLTGNAVGCAFVPLGTDQPDPARALAAVQAATSAAVPEARALGSAFEALAALARPVLTRPLVGVAAALRLFDRLPPLANLVVSFLSLPVEGLPVLGGRLRALYPLGPVPEGLGLNVTALRTQTGLFLGISGCAERAPWVRSLADALPEALDELSRALRGW